MSVLPAGKVTCATGAALQTKSTRMSLSRCQQPTAGCTVLTEAQRDAAGENQNHQTQPHTVKGHAVSSATELAAAQGV